MRWRLLLSGVGDLLERDSDLLLSSRLWKIALSRSLASSEVWCFILFSSFSWLLLSAGDSDLLLLLPVSSC